MLRYEDIPEDMLEEFEENFISLVRHEDLADGERRVDDVILLSVGSKLDVDRLEGYSYGGGPGIWYDFVAAPYGDDADKQLELVKNALSSP